jgi:hypothetical protein
MGIFTDLIEKPIDKEAERFKLNQEIANERGLTLINMFLKSLDGMGTIFLTPVVILQSGK